MSSGGASRPALPSARSSALACALGAASVLALAAGCAGATRNLAAAGPGREGCVQLATWAQEKSADGEREGESTAVEDSREAAACFHREGDDASARAALLTGLLVQARERVAANAAPTAKTGSFDDALARALAALSLSARARGEAQTVAQAEAALQAVHGSALDYEAGDRTAAAGSGEAISMIDGDCFFCARADVYGAAAREHVERLGSFAGVAYARRDDGREQFLVSTRLLADGEVSPQQAFADAMRRRGRPIADATPVALYRRTPAAGEASSLEAPLFRLTLRGFAFGDVQHDASAQGLALGYRVDGGDLLVRFPPRLLQRAGRDKHFVAPPEGVDAVVRYDGLDGGRPVYRVVILRHETAVAEGP